MGRINHGTFARRRDIKRAVQLRATCAQGPHTVPDSPGTTSLSETVRRRNVFARHSWENNFYIQRIAELSNTTVIEVLRPGDPDDMLLEAQSISGLLERFAVLSSTFALSRPDFHRVLAIRPDRSSSLDFTFGRQFYYLRSTARPAPVAKGIGIDDRFKRRFERCGFAKYF